MKVPFVLLLLLVFTVPPRQAEAIKSDSYHFTYKCSLDQIGGQFSSTVHTYTSSGLCPDLGLAWKGTGVYSVADGSVREELDFTGAPSSYRGHMTVRTACPQDPWLEAPPCRERSSAFTAGAMPVREFLQFITDKILFLQNVLTGSYVATVGGKPAGYEFPYDRGPLLAKLAADLQAEEAAAVAFQKQNKRLKQAVQPALPVVAPSIVLPTANALFLQNNTVPIKLLPPQGMAVTSFMVKLERLDPQGKWVIVTNLPVSVAEATSPAGYTGWGAPGNGRNPAQMVSLPGSYRISAQVSSPRQTLWSTPIPFAVTSTNKAIQKGPRMFGQ